MEIESCTRKDFMEILAEQQSFWGTDRALSAHHPFLIEEFGDTAFVIRDAAAVAAYLFGFFSQREPCFYIHLVAVRDSCKHHGLARRLYLHVEHLAQARRMTGLKAITPPFNAGSIAFHRALGFRLCGTAEENGIPFVPDYSGPGRHMVVLRKQLNAMTA